MPLLGPSVVKALTKKPEQRTADLVACKTPTTLPYGWIGFGVYRFEAGEPILVGELVGFRDGKVVKLENSREGRMLGRAVRVHDYASHTGLKNSVDVYFLL